jgi:microcystin-dependent protein
LTEPLTVNVGFVVPNTGDLVGTWGSNALNPDFSVADGFFGGVQSLSLSNAPVTLSVPSGFTATPSAGPTQSQNAVLRLTGALTSNLQVTLPMPGPMIVENLTTGNFVVTLGAPGAGQVIAVDQGEVQRIYNDGTNVRFVNLGRVGAMEIWAGLTAMPAWVTACSVPPYLLCDGSVYNFSTYPYLGKRFLSQFGGNGITTFGVPDLRGRVPIPYDGTGTRITTAGCGINGQTIGAAGGGQNETLLQANLPNVNFSVSGTITVTSTPTDVVTGTVFGSTVGGGAFNGLTGASDGPLTSTGSGSSLTVPSGGSATPVTTVPPAQVAGIAVVRAA